MKFISVSALNIPRTILLKLADKGKDIVRLLAVFFAAVFFSLFSSHKALAGNLPEPLLTKEEIFALITLAEKKHKIPLGLLKSVANVESGSNQFYLNISGKTIKAKTFKEVLDIANNELAKGNNNIDLGLMQINLRWHGKEFANLEQMIEPQNNIEYAAKLLSSLNKKHKSWHKAVRYYHSATPQYSAKYSRKVLLSWLK